MTDLSALDLEQLEELRAAVTARIAQLKHDAREKLLDEFGLKAARLGFSLEEIVPPKRGRPRRAASTPREEDSDA